MRTVERSFEQLRRANPVPNPAALRRELRQDADHATRSTPMETITTEIKTQPPSKGPRNWTTGLVAAAVVLVLGIAGLTFLTDGGPFAGREPTPVEIAEAYMTAYDNYDAANARELLAGDVAMADATFRDLEDLEAAFEMRRRIGFRVSPFDCEQGRSDEFVSCTYNLNSRLQEITGYPPIEARFSFNIRDGLIVRLLDGFPYSEFSPNLYEPFVRWLDAEHPGALDSLFYSVGGADYPQLTPEALELIDTYLDLYEEWLAEQGD